MAADVPNLEVPVAESTLRELARDVPRIFATDLTRSGADTGLNRILNLFDAVLETAERTDLAPVHRAATCNTLCALIDNCQASTKEHVRDAVLEDVIWLRTFRVYLDKSDNAKGKSMRQMLMSLTNVLLQQARGRALDLRDMAILTFLDIICQRNDRLTVKPALQGLSHFLQKDLVSTSDLVNLYRRTMPQCVEVSGNAPEILQDILASFLQWIVHHDTALSAGHLVKNYLIRVRRITSDPATHLPLWIEPVANALRQWLDRVQEFRTHVFPHCFLPNVEEYIHFLAYLHFDRYIQTQDSALLSVPDTESILSQTDDSEEFQMVLAAIQSGKELGIVKDVDTRQRNGAEYDGDSLFLPDIVSSRWLSNPAPEARLTSLYLSIFSSAVTRPIANGVFKSLKRNLVHLHTDTDANFRKELLSHITRLFDRLRGSTATLAKIYMIDTARVAGRLPVSTYVVRSGRHILHHTLRNPLVEPFDFILWYIQFLTLELRSTSSYQRRITALRSLTIILKSGLDPTIPNRHLSKSAQGQLRWAHGLRVSNGRLMRSLLDLVLDPFDDIRTASADILEICLDSLPVQEQVPALVALPQFIRRAEGLMVRTGRADQADGVARAYALQFSQCNDNLPFALETHPEQCWTKVAVVSGLIEQLEETIGVAQRDLSAAVNGRPVHGIFAALRYIFDQSTFYVDIVAQAENEIRFWKDVHSRIHTCFRQLWSCVWHVLCADAPEGHVPDEIDEEANIDTKEILSYSWRALKEASLLLRSIISNAPLGDGIRALVNCEQAESAGRLCFVQLAELRHRGAFSTVAQTFAACCRRFARAEQGALNRLPKIWYQETFLCIQAKSTSITRRSAGLPSLMTGILAAEAQPGGALFARAMKDLILEASVDAQHSNIEESRLPQVHALNCIKEFFMTSKLSAVSEAHIAQGLELAARTLNSKIWPIRNCSLMLFKALIERLLGSDEAQDWKEQDRNSTSRFSYQSYPTLSGILTDLLDPSGPLKRSMESTSNNSPMDLHGAEGVFPALQILRQATPPEFHRPAMMELITCLLDSPHWHLRDMAARTLVSLHHTDELYDGILKLLSSLDASQNSRHGSLLALKYMLKKYLHVPAQTDEGQLENITIKLVQLNTLSGCNSDDYCPITQSAILDLINICIAPKVEQRSGVSEAVFWQDVRGSSQDSAQIDEHHGRASSLLRRAKGQFLCNTMSPPGSQSGNSSGDEEGIAKLSASLERLHGTDPDTCCALLDSLAERISDSKQEHIAGEGLGLFSILNNLMLRSEDEEVLSRAQSILSGCWNSAQNEAVLFQKARGSTCLETLDKLETRCLEGSPSNAQSALHLMGVFLDFAYSQKLEDRKSILRRVARFIRIIRMTILDTNPFDARFAAVQSIAALNDLWGIDLSYRPASSCILSLACLLYDLLNDDDEEIRDIAATTTSRLLRAQGSTPFADAVPVITVNRLGHFLTSRFTFSESLCKEAMRRLTGSSNGQTIVPQSFRDALADTMEEDTALFSKEKQNLYQDETEDAAFWSQVLRSVNTRALNLATINALSDWVLKGLAALNETAKAEVDGPLGWTTKPEVFVLGMRVFFSVEVVMKCNVNRAKVMLALREFADVGSQSEVNGTWLERVESILEATVLGMVGKVSQSLPNA
ncbi:hypothetical protein K491DRAFT_756956 [Lophiostoma macrostomum CBS 122681]|uniref:Uncharacterized protein n=1 Tax=Lophiostoma macrostomum CBS 122681 TaxID=1314788 RepID=A0A6A6TE71_9PLEO|nr:hypothetical protein K491DRAFT_756956 [Lophiostoma macrostomum CBS 122681]